MVRALTDDSLHLSELSVLEQYQPIFLHCIQKKYDKTRQAVQGQPCTKRLMLSSPRRCGSVGSGGWRRPQQGPPGGLLELPRQNICPSRCAVLLKRLVSTLHVVSPTLACWLTLVTVAFDGHGAAQAQHVPL